MPQRRSLTSSARACARGRRRAAALAIVGTATLTICGGDSAGTTTLVGKPVVQYQANSAQNIVVVSFRLSAANGSKQSAPGKWPTVVHVDTVGSVSNVYSTPNADPSAHCYTAFLKSALRPESAPVGKPIGVTVGAVGGAKQDPLFAGDLVLEQAPSPTTPEASQPPLAGC